MTAAGMLNTRVLQSGLDNDIVANDVDANNIVG